MSNSAEMDGMSHGEGAGTYLGVRDAKYIVNTTDGIGSHADMSTEHGDVPRVNMDVAMTANEPETISIPQKQQKPPESSSQATRQTPNVPNTCRSHTDVLSMYMDMQSIAHQTEMARNEAECVRTPRNHLKPQNLPMETTRWCPDEPNGCGSHTDVLSIHTDGHS